MKPRTWAEVFVLFPGTVNELADHLTLTRMGLHNLRSGSHARPPHHLLGRLAAVLQKRWVPGMRAPTQADLTALWIATFGDDADGGGR